MSNVLKPSKSLGHRGPYRGGVGPWWPRESGWVKACENLENRHLNTNAMSYFAILSESNAHLNQWRCLSQKAEINDTVSVCLSLSYYFGTIGPLWPLPNLTPQLNRGEVIFSLQFVCVCVCPALLVNKIPAVLMVASTNPF